MAERQKKVYDQRAVQRIGSKKEELEKHLENIRLIMSGQAENLYGALLDEKDRIDGEKLDRMIDSMIAALCDHREMMGEAPLSDDLEKWYRSYLYLAITGPNGFDWDFNIGELYSNKNYTDIYFPCERDMERTSLCEMVWRENHSWSSTEDEEYNFLYTMKEALELLSKKGIREFYTDEEKEALAKTECILEWGMEDFPEGMDHKAFWEGIQKEKAGWDEQIHTAEDFTNYLIAKGYLSESDAEEAKTTGESGAGPVSAFEESGEYAEEDVREDFEEPLYTEEEYGIDTALMDDEFSNWREEMMQQNIDESIDRWISRMPEDHRFEKEYLYFRRNYFRVDRKAFRADMEHLVEVYLYEQGRSAYSLEDSYGIVDKALSVSEERIQHEIIRARIGGENFS